MVNTAFQTASALALANPFVITHWGNGDFARCFEASCAGAEALRRLGVPTARAVPCRLSAQDAAQGVGLSMGLSYRQIYDRTNWGEMEKLSFEEWRAAIPDMGLSEEEMERPHAVILVDGGGQTTLIDLTVAQLRPRGFAVPLHLKGIMPDPEGVVFDLAEGLAVQYEIISSGHEDLFEHYNEGLVSDYIKITQLALRCDRDQDKLWRAIGELSPALHDETLRILNRWFESLPASPR